MTLALHPVPRTTGQKRNERRTADALCRDMYGKPFSELVAERKARRGGGG